MGNFYPFMNMKLFFFLSLSLRPLHTVNLKVMRDWKSEAFFVKLHQNHPWGVAKFVFVVAILLTARVVFGWFEDTFSLLPRFYYFLLRQSFTFFHFFFSSSNVYLTRILFVAQYNKRFMVHAVIVCWTWREWQAIWSVDTSNICHATCCIWLWVKYTWYAHHAPAEANPMYNNNAHQNLEVQRQELLSTIFNNDCPVASHLFF